VTPDTSYDFRSDPVWAELLAKPEENDCIDSGVSRRFAAADRIRSFISRQAVDHWLAYGNLRYPQISLSYAGQAAPPTTYTRPRRVGEHRSPVAPIGPRFWRRWRAGPPWCSST
jgi:hypothetical protein